MLVRRWRGLVKHGPSVNIMSSNAISLLNPEPRTASKRSCNQKQSIKEQVTEVHCECMNIHIRKKGMSSEKIGAAPDKNQTYEPPCSSRMLYN